MAALIAASVFKYLLNSGYFSNNRSATIRAKTSPPLGVRCVVSLLYGFDAASPIALTYLLDSAFRSIYAYDPALAASIVAALHSTKLSANFPFLNRVRESGVTRIGVPPAALMSLARPMRFFSKDAGVIPDPWFWSLCANYRFISTITETQRCQVHIPVALRRLSTGLRPW
jgi:hypothetical protein